jgi:8-oxo-dGTP diphosphatase
VTPTSCDGFVTLADGSRRWGRYGAAGVLVRHAPPPGEGGEVCYFVALRSQWCHHGGTWAMPGGARNVGESPVDAAVREFAEEIGVSLDEVGYEVAELYEDDHGGWSYWTVVVDVSERFEAPPAFHWETADARWVTRDELAELPLFDAFRTTLERLELIPPP